MVRDNRRILEGKNVAQAEMARSMKGDFKAIYDNKHTTATIISRAQERQDPRQPTHPVAFVRVRGGEAGATQLPSTALSRDQAALESLLRSR